MLDTTKWRTSLQKLRGLKQRETDAIIEEISNQTPEMCAVKNALEPNNSSNRLKKWFAFIKNYKTSKPILLTTLYNKVSFVNISECIRWRELTMSNIPIFKISKY